MPARAQRNPVQNATGDVLRRLSVADFTGSGENAIQAIATDASGNIYVAGTTGSANFSVQNAEQPAFGDATVLMTTDLGNTWTRAGMTPGPVNTLVVDPVAPQTLFAEGQDGIYKSIDGGATWTTVFAFKGNVSAGALSLAIDPGNHLHLAAVEPELGSETLLRSVDGGETWTPGASNCFEAESCGGALMADPTGSGALLTIGLGMYISRDWGLTFQEIHVTGAIGSPSSAAFDPSHPGWIYVCVSGGSIGTVWLTTDFGTTWTQKASTSTEFSAIQYMAVDPDQPNIIVAGTASGLYLSSNGAASWVFQQSLGFPPNTAVPFVLAPLACSPTGGVFAPGSAGIGTYSVAFSPDFGVTWQTPHLTGVTSVAAGPNCAFYVTRNVSTDAFIAKVAAEGGVEWATYLGGSDADSAVGLAVDGQGGVYVAGNTSSPDFPATAPHLGQSGEDAMFAAHFSASGALLSSVTIGGSLSNLAYAMALDGSGDAYIAGITNSVDFPVTASAIAPAPSSGNYEGVLAKIGPNATLAAGSYLGFHPSSAVVDRNGDPVIAGYGEPPSAASGVSNGPTLQFLVKLDPSASQILVVGNLPPFELQAPTGLAVDSQNNVFVWGGTGSFQASPGAYSAPAPAASPVCGIESSLLDSPEAFVLKLGAADWSTIWGAVVTAPCGIETGAISLDANDNALLAMASDAGLPLAAPLIAGATCGFNSSAVAKLSADGSSLLGSTYLDNCGVPGIAFAPDGSVYAGVSPVAGEGADEVLHLTNSSAGISIGQIANAFSGDPSAVAPAGLYSISVSGVTLASINLTIDPTADLPNQLGGVQVTFDGRAAPILSTGPGRIIVATPEPLPPHPVAKPKYGRFTSVQVSVNGVMSNAVLMPVVDSLPGLLTADFPNPTSQSDGNVQNQDGTQNSAKNPAALGSTITVFATGMGKTNPLIDPGSVSHTLAVAPLIPVYDTWETFNINGPAVSAVPVFSVPGFVSAMFQLQIEIPESIPGLVSGVSRALVGLEFEVDPEETLPVSNWIGVYIQNP